MNIRAEVKEISYASTDMKGPVPYAHIVQSLQWVKNFLNVNLSGNESPRSSSMRFNMYFVSAGLRNLFLSGKSTTKMYVMRPRKIVIAPSIICRFTC
jgi:hypothetical protein